MACRIASTYIYLRPPNKNVLIQVLRRCYMTKHPEQGQSAAQKITEVACDNLSTIWENMAYNAIRLGDCMLRRPAREGAPGGKGGGGGGGSIRNVLLYHCLHGDIKVVGLPCPGSAYWHCLPV